ncbi:MULTISPECIES: hypothetical protein [unclassified Symbiopectobacterium]|uniref:hypothetical protein n=1 Tax=unclassified Symbiopectobacterium TaxID=2794573 RepID=UPI00222782D5|nr:MULTISPECIES: hypothetical protein [unclassified Symbiopectobacterium]MCW2473134.1 hypothetical protein [Candidatus Symbiopectobacterium sp. NZEC151]MCW2484306.1 hypothetical protein [Candidatus Symbiopectobacterium sp. NZEC127]
MDNENKAGCFVTVFITYDNDFQCLYLFGGKRFFFRYRYAIAAIIVPVVMLWLSLKSFFTFIAFSDAEVETDNGVFL